jgi:hypothetical protein
MGLNAVVYRNIHSLAPGLRRRVRVAEPATGELEFVSQGSPDPNYNDALIAISIRIGNAASVDWLRDQVRSRWTGECNILLSTVLFSGSHSGDFINLEGTEKMRREIEEMDAAEAELPEDLARFLAEMRQLLDVAESERNPIVFV